MQGAIIGDIIGSPYESKRMKFFDYNFPLLSEKSNFTLKEFVEKYNLQEVEKENT